LVEEKGLESVEVSLKACEDLEETLSTTILVMYIEDDDQESPLGTGSSRK